MRSLLAILLVALVACAAPQSRGVALSRAPRMVSAQSPAWFPMRQLAARRTIVIEIDGYRVEGQE